MPTAVLADGSAARTTQQYLDEAKAHLAAGRHNAALDAFDAAISKDETNYNTYFRRGTVHLSIGRTESALRDFTKVLELRPDHHQAMMQRSKILLKECNLDDAVEELTKYAKTNPTDADAQKMLHDAQEAKSGISKADKLIKSQKYEEAIESLNAAISVCPSNIDLRFKRAECYLQTDNKEMGIADLTRASRMGSGNLKTHVRLAKLHLSLGELATAIGSLRECLRSDPEEKECKKEYRAIKKLEKAFKEVDELVEKNKWRQVMPKLEGDTGLLAVAENVGAPALKLKVYAYACQASGQTKKHAQALHWCDKTLELDSENYEALIYRGEARLSKEEYEPAMNDFQKAHNMNQQDSRPIEGYQKAQRLQRQASQKDYYKVLGVSRTATTRDIRKAYRKLSKEWHPDTASGEKTKEELEKKMSEINEAYEVLSNEELRQRFDNGDDPNAQQQGGGGPFGHGGGHPFFFQQGGGGGGFPFGGGFPGGGFPGGGGGQFHFKFQ
ncbi:hypothetical protein HDV00_011997 [Rhizophlyctis rosea]|nr:hypothetical protein HDV00_011997 [Rhizophlyctis rosea]